MGWVEMTNSSGQYYAKLGSIRQDIESGIANKVIPASIYICMRDYINILWNDLQGCTVSQINAQRNIDSLWKYLGDHGQE